MNMVIRTGDAVGTDDIRYDQIGAVVMPVKARAEELGMRIPDDLSVVGFDNISEAKYLGLTTVDQFLADMGYIAIQMLVKLINKEPLDEQIHKMPTKLVERSSCRDLAQVF